MWIVAVTWVVAALNLIPKREQMPSPADADNTTRITPTIPTAACDWTRLHFVSDTHAYMHCNNPQNANLVNNNNNNNNVGSIFHSGHPSESPLTPGGCQLVAANFTIRVRQSAARGWTVSHPSAICIYIITQPSHGGWKAELTWELQYGLAVWLSGSDVGLWLADFPWSMVNIWPLRGQCPLWVNRPGQLSLPSLLGR